MSHRRDDQGLIEWLRNLEARIKKLETQDKGVRQNTLRLGDMVLEADDRNSRVGIRNIKKGGNIKWLPERKETFGWVGAVVLDEDNTSPPAQIFDTMTIVEVVLSVLTPSMGGDITANLNIMTAEHGLLMTIPMTIPAGEYRSVTDQMIEVHHGQSMWVELINAGDGMATNLTMTVRFDG